MQISLDVAPKHCFRLRYVYSPKHRKAHGDDSTAWPVIWSITEIFASSICQRETGAGGHSMTGWIRVISGRAWGVKQGWHPKKKRLFDPSYRYNPYSDVLWEEDELSTSDWRPRSQTVGGMYGHTSQLRLHFKCVSYIWATVGGQDEIISQALGAYKKGVGISWYLASYSVHHP